MTCGLFQYRPNQAEFEDQTSLEIPPEEECLFFEKKSIEYIILNDIVNIEEGK